MSLTLKNLILIPAMVLLMLGATGCNSSSSSSADSIPEVAASDEDIETLSVMAGQQFEADPQSAAVDNEINGASVAGLLSLENGTTFNFFDSVLTAQDNTVTYNAIGYTFADNFENDGVTYWLFSKEVSDNFFSEIQISSANNFITNILSTVTITNSDTQTTISLTGDSRIDYFDANASIGRFSIDNMVLSLVLDTASVGSVAHADHDTEETPVSEDSSYSFIGTLSMPFSLVINDIIYSGEFESSFTADTINTADLVSPLIRDGKNIGEVRVGGDDSELHIFLRNEEGDLVEISNS